MCSEQLGAHQPRDYDVGNCSDRPAHPPRAASHHSSPAPFSASLASEIDRLKTPASLPRRDGLGPHPIFSLVYLTPLPRSHLFRMMHLSMDTQRVNPCLVSLPAGLMVDPETGRSGSRRPWHTTCSVLYQEGAPLQ